MTSHSTTTQESSPELFGYVIGKETQVVLLAKPPSFKGWMVVLVLPFGLVAISGFEALWSALLLCVGLCSIVAFIHRFPQLVLVALEEQAITLVRATAFGKRFAVRIPNSEIMRVERGNEYFPADFTIVQQGGYFHDIALVTKGKRARPVFHRLLNRTSLPFPENPQTHLYEIAEQLSSLLADHGLTVQVAEMSVLDQVVWRIFPPWKPR